MRDFYLAACGAWQRRFLRIEAAIKKRSALLEADGWPTHITTSWWEVDHIVEVVRGGDGVMENLQTLCWPCHRLKTARLARERADERRRARQPEFI